MLKHVGQKIHTVLAPKVPSKSCSGLDIVRSMVHTMLGILFFSLCSDCND